MNTFSKFASQLFRGSVSSNSYSYINRQNVGVSFDPSGTDYIDYSNNNAYFTDSHNINPNDENTTSLILNNSDSNYLNLSSLDEFTIYMKYQVYDSSNIPVLGQMYNNPNYDISFSNSSPLVGDSFQVYVLNGSGTTLTYSISGDFTSANLNGASLTGSLPYIENILDYTISSGGGEFKFLLNVTDVSGIINIIKTYWVTVQYNLFGEKVFAFSETGENGTFYNQKSLTFTTGDSVRFDVSDPSNNEFILDFGSTIDSASVPFITRTGIPGQSSAIVALTVPDSYSGDVIYYFEDSSANMGYKPAISEEYFQDILIVADFSENLFTSDDSSVWDAYGYKENTYNRNESTNTLLNGTYVFRSDRSSIAVNMNYKEPKSVISSISTWCRFERYVEILFPFFIRVESSQVSFRPDGGGVSDYYLYGIDAYDVSYELLDVSGATSDDPVRSISSNKHFKKLHIEGKDNHTRIKGWAINGYVIDSTSLVSGTTLQYEVTVSGDVFSLSGTDQLSIAFEPNNSYLFDQSDPTNAGQQIVFGYIRDNSSNIFTSADGVTLMGTPGQPGAYTYLDLSAGFTGTLYYYSDGSANMGMGLLSDFAYSFTVQNNIYDEPVWAVYDDANSIYYNQPDLSFSAPYVYEFDVSDSSNNDYVLTFGTTVDVSSTEVDSEYIIRNGTPGTANASVILNLTNYSGSPLVYFEDSSAGMGYVEPNMDGTLSEPFSVSIPSTDINFNSSETSHSTQTLANARFAYYDPSVTTYVPDTFTHTISSGGSYDGTYIASASSIVGHNTGYGPHKLFLHDLNKSTHFGGCDFYYTTATNRKNSTNDATTVNQSPGKQTYAVASSGGFSLAEPSYSAAYGRIGGTDGDYANPNNYDDLFFTEDANSGVKTYGEWFQIQFPYQLVMSDFIIYPRNTVNHHDRAPDKATLFGSNDGSNWVKLNNWTGISYSTVNSTYTSGTISVNETVGYYYYRLVGESLAGSVEGVYTIANWVINGEGNRIVLPTTYTVSVSNSVPNSVFDLSGSLQPQVDFIAGRSYVFDQSDSTNAGEQIVFGISEDNKDNLYTTGVTIVGTPGQPGAYTQIVVPSDFVGTLYYYSLNTTGMGNR